VKENSVNERGLQEQRLTKGQAIFGLDRRPGPRAQAVSRRTGLVVAGMVLVWLLSGRDWTGVVIALALGVLVTAYTTQLRRSVQLWAETRADQ
jgi:hypothetical protein